jgi:hypothetical protein
MIFRRKRKRDSAHQEINRRLDEQQAQLESFAKRLRLLEIEAGFHDRPPLTKVQGGGKK